MKTFPNNCIQNVLFKIECVHYLESIGTLSADGQWSSQRSQIWKTFFKKTKVPNSTSVSFPSDNQWALMWDHKIFLVTFHVAMNCKYREDFKSLAFITWISLLISCSTTFKSEWNFLATVTCPLGYRSLTNDTVNEFCVWLSLKPCCGAILRIQSSLSNGGHTFQWGINHFFY